MFSLFSDYRVLQPRGQPGVVIVTASISSYIEKHLKMAGSPISVRIMNKIGFSFLE